MNRSNVGGRRARKPITQSQTFWGYICLAPIILGFLVFSLIPVIMSLYYSFTKYDGIGVPKWIGLRNYTYMFANEEFLGSLLNTAYYALGVVPVGTALALLFAIALNSKIRGRNFYRSVYFVPNIVSFVAVAMVWQWLYEKDYGLFNTVLGMLGLPQPGWLTTTQWAMPSVVIMSIWKSLGFYIIIFLAGLQEVPATYYEAATIDGANMPQKFLHITLPLLKSTTLFVLVISLIGAFQTFDQIYLLTNGGPNRATQVVVYLVYQNAFAYFKQGYASAMSYVLFIIIFAATLIQFRITGKDNLS